MKNNISVFILIILLASSFKYRAKTGAIANTVLQNATVVGAQDNKINKADFTTFVDKMQQANQQVALGDSKALKDLWLHSSDASIYCGSSGVQVTGWQFVEERIDWHRSQLMPGSKYLFEKISQQSGENFASLQQTEHYISQNGQRMDLGVTILFERREGSWKIIHRHAENLSSRIASM